MTLQASVQAPAAVFVCFGRRVGISKTQFSTKDMRRTDSSFAICHLCYRGPTGRPSKKSIVQRRGGMNARLCDDGECALRGAAQLRAFASRTNKSGDLGPATADTSSLSVINYQVLAVYRVLVPACLRACQPGLPRLPLIPPNSGPTTPSSLAPLVNQVCSHDRR